MMPVVTDDGAWRGLKAQVADVSKALQSVRALVHALHTVVIGGCYNGCSHYVHNRISGEWAGVKDDGSNFIMNMWVLPKAEAGFGRLE